MSYVQRSLAPGERIVYQTKLHRVIFIPPAVVFVAAFAAFETGLAIAAGTALAAAITVWFVVFRMYRASEFIVTNRRVFGGIGGGASYAEVALIELQAADFKPGVMSSLFDYGTVVLTDRGGKIHKFSGVPKELYEHVQARDERVRRILR